MTWSPVERRFFLPTAFATEKLTVSTATKILTAATYGTESLTRAIIQCESQDIRYRFDGTAASSTDGFTLKAGDSVTIIGLANLANFKAVRAGGSDGTLQVTYLK